MGSDRFKWLIIIGIFLIFFLGGYLIYQVFKPKPPAWQPSQEVSAPQVTTPAPRPGMSSTATSSAQTLPRTGAPLGLLAIFASSVIISGYFLRKFPQ